MDLLLIVLVCLAAFAYRSSWRSNIFFLFWFAAFICINRLAIAFKLHLWHPPLKTPNRVLPRRVQFAITSLGLDFKKVVSWSCFKRNQCFTALKEWSWLVAKASFFICGCWLVEADEFPHLLCPLLFALLFFEASAYVSIRWNPSLYVVSSGCEFCWGVLKQGLVPALEVPPGVVASTWCRYSRLTADVSGLGFDSVIGVWGAWDRGAWGRDLLTLLPDDAAAAEGPRRGRWLKSSPRYVASLLRALVDYVVLVKKIVLCD